MNGSEPIDPKRSERALGRQLRGSSLLLAGRVLSKFVNFGIQIAIVRLLTKDDYGAFAYGLALALAGELIVKFGLGRGANRYVPYYAERGDRAEVIGTLALASSVILGLGAICFALLLWISTLGWSGFPSGEGGRVVLILAALAPIQALDTICIQTLACFSKPRAIFFRKHVLGPALRAGAVAGVFFAGGSSEMLAAAYFAGGVVGILVCIRLTLTELHAHGILPLPFAEWRVPWRPLFRFSIPLISSDLVFITLTAVTTVLLMSTHGEAGVASMRAVVPAAALNVLVAQSFGLLFMPAAIRVHAQGDRAGLRRHHWQSSAWVAVLSFPIFALTFGVAPDLVPVLLGSQYAESASLLALLAFGHYLSVCMGFNGEMLQVLERTRAIVWTDIMMIGLGASLAALLCPAYGPLGAAVSVTVARLSGTLVRQVVLLRTTDLGPVPRSFVYIWLRVLVASAFIGIFGWLWQPPLLGQLAVVALASLALLRSTASQLDLEGSFPELLRIPLFSRLAGT
jgi:O-antigen/teichoic acid export membrane protein